MLLSQPRHEGTDAAHIVRHSLEGLKNIERPTGSIIDALLGWPVIREWLESAWVKGRRGKAFGGWFYYFEESVAKPQME